MLWLELDGVEVGPPPGARGHLALGRFGGDAELEGPRVLADGRVLAEDQLAAGEIVQELRDLRRHLVRGVVELRSELLDEHPEREAVVSEQLPISAPTSFVPW